MFKQLHINISLADALILIPKYQEMLKSLLSNKEKLIEFANTPLNENCLAVILKKLPEKLGDPGKFLIPYGFSELKWKALADLGAIINLMPLSVWKVNCKRCLCFGWKFHIPCGFNELKCKALADLGASINLMPLSVWKELGLPKLIPTQMTLELANHDICTLKGIARDVFIPVRKFTFPADFVIVDYESDPRVSLILGRPFLRTARALIDVHGEEMILRDGNERLILNMRNDTSSYSNEPHQESINMIDVYNVLHEEIREDLFATNHPSGNPTSLVSSHTNLTSPEVVNQLSGNPTPILEPETKSSSSSPTLISLKERNDDLPFDAESDLLELEYLLNHDPIKDMDSILKDSVDENSLDD
ncbi:reverse transcriptase domain-containing protein, partial [Tanacetum coccineum]